MKLSDFRIRDPFILPVPAENCYYMYGTTPTAPGEPRRFDCHRSADLEEWSDPITVFKQNPDFWGTADFWAPEVHYWNRRYYMFASFKAEGIHRGTHILVADTPAGPFIPVSPEPATPPDWECLDGTLYIDDEGEPWIVFSHEWCQIQNGTICAQRLSMDLTERIGDAVTMFDAKSAPWATVCKGDTYVTDGPFMLNANGELICMWSSFSANGYAAGFARALDNRIDGRWEHIAKPLAIENAGHSMCFSSLDGRKRYITMHQPNDSPMERAIILPFEYGQEL